MSKPELTETLDRQQLLIIMGLTAVILMAIAKVWQYVGGVTLLPLEITGEATAIALGLAAIIMVASKIIYELWPRYRRSADEYLEFVLRPLESVDIIWLALLPGLSEELLFRGVMLSALGLNTLAVILSSGVFGVLHVSGRDSWPYMVWAMMIGLLLGWSAIATGNLWVPIFAHIITNFSSSLSWMLKNKPSSQH